jgi:hypothetical protein
MVFPLAPRAAPTVAPEKVIVAVLPSACVVAAESPAITEPPELAVNAAT